MPPFGAPGYNPNRSPVQGPDTTAGPDRGGCVPFCARPSREPECPVDAIKPDTEPGLEKWLSINTEYAKLWPNITLKKEPPADAKEWEGVPDKEQYFSPNPGDGT